MRIATFNIEHGEAALGSEHHGEVPDARSLVRLADDLRALDIDVLCLQEVDQGQRRSGGLNQAEILSRELGMHQYRFAAFFQGWVGGLRVQPLRSDAGGRMAFGIATLSRLPVTSWHVNTRRGTLPKLKLREGGGGWRPSERLAEIGHSADWQIPDYFDTLVLAATRRDPRARIADDEPRCREIVRQIDPRAR